jgi:hypothetical protein
MSLVQPLSPLQYDRPAHREYYATQQSVVPLSSSSQTRKVSNPVISGATGSTTVSAPASPMGRTGLPPGLAPLSLISPIHLEKRVEAGGIYGSNVVTDNQPSFNQTQSIPVHIDPSRPQQSQSTTPLKPQGTSPRGGPFNRRLSSRLPSRPRAFTSTSSSEETVTETEIESDTTFVPGRIRAKHSSSQPDLMALRSWAGDVARGQAEERRARALRKTPPKRLPLSLASPKASSPNETSAKSKSQPSLTSLLRSPSPHRARNTNPITPLTPVFSPATDYFNLERSDVSSTSSRPLIYSGGLSGSSDADASASASSTDLDSPSSGSISFSPKRRNFRRIASTPKSSSLGLTLSPDNSDTELDTISGVQPPPIPKLIERRLQQSTLLSLRLLAIVPALWGICVLIQALVLGGWYVDVWPWGVDLTREALERLVAGGTEAEGRWKDVSRGDMLISIAWVGDIFLIFISTKLTDLIVQATCTAQFCFHLTTGLTHRWRSYYSLPSTLTRLLSLQCLCWPATYLTLAILGADRPLLAWVVIGVTTGWSRTIQMWVTSNVSTIPSRGSSGSTGGSGNGHNPGTGMSGIDSRKLPPEGLGRWDSFVWGRRWDWDDIAREVGWKVGSLMLVTTAWLFWKIENGWI